MIDTADLTCCETKAVSGVGEPEPELKIFAVRNYRSASLIISVTAIALWNPAGAAENKGMTVPERHWSLVCELPSGHGSSIGIWRRMAVRTSIGMEVPFRLERRKESVSSSSNISRVDRQGVYSEQSRDDGDVQITELMTGLRTGLKKYLDQDGPGFPFLFAGAFVHFTGSKKEDPVTTAIIRENQDDGERLTSRFSEDLRAWSTETGIELGAGMDWFPTEFVSVGGGAGIRFSLTQGERSHSFLDSVKMDHVSSAQSTTSTTGSNGYVLALFTSRLKVQFYF